MSRDDRNPVRDLRKEPPRRWSDAIEGIVWLPRLIDKMRAYQTGTLGTYLLGQSPVDDELLACAKTDYAGFARIVAAHATDAEVLHALEALHLGNHERLVQWSRTMPKKRALHMQILDLDDGYTGGAKLRALVAVGNIAFAPFATLLRTVKPVRL